MDEGEEKHNGNADDFDVVDDVDDGGAEVDDDDVLGAGDRRIGAQIEPRGPRLPTGPKNTHESSRTCYIVMKCLNLWDH